MSGMPAPPAQPWRTLVALVVILLAVAVSACNRGPQSVSLAELATQPERYHGTDIETAGVVIEFGPEDGALVRHYVVQDADANRVELQPQDIASRHVGQTVRVVGPFTYDESSGRLLRIDRIAPAADTLSRR